MKNLTRCALLLGFFGLMLVSSVFFPSCGDDDDDDSGKEEETPCEPVAECTEITPLSTTLPEREFELPNGEACENLGLEIEVLEVRMKDNRSRMEAQLRITVLNGGPYYTGTITSKPDTPYQNAEGCFLEIVDSGTYNVVQLKTYCSSTMAIGFWTDKLLWECPDPGYVEEACLFPIDILPWPPEGDCIEDPS